MFGALLDPPRDRDRDSARVRVRGAVEGDVEDLALGSAAFLSDRDFWPVFGEVRAVLARTGHVRVDVREGAPFELRPRKAEDGR